MVQLLTPDGVFLLSMLSILSSYCWPDALAATSDGLTNDLAGKGFDVVFPTDERFVNVSQAFNRRYTPNPAAVAFPSTAQQVSQIVKVGYERGYNVVARSGGHSYAAHGLGIHPNAIVVDLSSIKTLSVDTDKNTAVIGAGNRLGEVVLGLNKYGRALPHGTCAYVGWGGHATLGGYGFTSRMWGLSVDTVESMEVVLANGTLVSTSEKWYPELFWATPYLGIVVSTTVRTFAVPPSATIFSVSYPNLGISQATTALLHYQRWSRRPDIPKAIGLQAVLTRGSESGKVGFGFSGGWYAPVSSDGLDLNRTLKPLVDGIGVEPTRVNFDSGDYVHSAENLAGGSLDTTQPGGRDTFYAKSLVIPEDEGLREGTVREFVTVFATQGFETPLGWWFIQLDLFGGRDSAINDKRPEDTAFPHRRGLWGIQLYASTRENVPPYPEGGFEFLDDAVNAILKNSPRPRNFGAYANYIDDRLGEGAPDLYFKSNWKRILRVKEKYDPTGVFELPDGW
ncbi:hypothetical protein CC1G_09291 [Coprinopsis cinerea okayama7|uniref:FAD-binding PCMH-type domain-containing protein n=1 Tax=Coprinopsis cinerea (strain Okayama-7 / 130 / ATCC MYA-4618 / FGSC 9003) TaxID=240176 RepID=A8N870_COPC7|nr:hypothetical protein CC1G_09291 [Coprinopsis cinerea okayama7\|eukprot:XP_001831026.2 hypothetical protein CC1G_09291 [Coprinopsis cinerea okayama7\